MDHDESRTFLLGVQDYIIHSADNSIEQGLAGEVPEGIDPHRLLPSTLAPLLPRIAHDVQKSRSMGTDCCKSRQDRVLAEVAIATASINAMKAFSLLNVSSRLSIGRGLLQYCMLSNSLAPVGRFTDEKLASLELEMQVG